MSSLSARIYVHPTAGPGGISRAAALFDGRRLELRCETASGTRDEVAPRASWRCTLSLDDGHYALGGQDARGTLSDFDPEPPSAVVQRNATFLLLDGEHVLASGTVTGVSMPGAASSV